jgi:hypothetical protein
LHIPQDQLDPNFHYRFFKEVGQRIEQALQAGFIFADDDKITVGEREGNTDIGGKISVLGGDDPSQPGGAYRLVLMKQPIEFFKEDQQLKQDRVDGLNAQINRTIRGDKVENAYTPAGTGPVYRP